MGKLAPVLAFIKKNLLILICAIVAIAAFAALFWPIAGYYAQLQTDANARQQVYTTLTGLIKKTRTLPLLDPTSTDAQPLDRFPTDSIIARGTLVTQAVHDESDAMMKAAMGLVTHQPLVPDALPNGGTRLATLFLRKYQDLFPASSTTTPGYGQPAGGAPVDPNINKNTLAATILHAGMPPSDADIKQALDDLKNNITSEKTLYDTSGKPVNAPAVAANVLAAQLAAPDQMRYAAATQNKMYIAPDAYHIHPMLVGTAPPSTVTMFNGQLSLWLLQDVFSALAAANADSKNGVITSKVKHLIKIEYKDEPLGNALSPEGAAGMSAAAGATPPSNDPLHPTIDKTKSPTGHVSNALYDVVPFNLKLIVDVSSIPDVLLALSRDRFITVLRVDLLTVDSGEAALSGFIYGDKPCVQLNISAEELFFRQDTTPYMPDPIKRALGVAPPAAPGTP